MLAETGIVLLTDIMILVHKTGALSWRTFEPAVFMQGNLGITFIFTIAAFIGFKSTAIYAKKCRSSQKTVPRATLKPICQRGKRWLKGSINTVKRHPVVGS